MFRLKLGRLDQSRAAFGDQGKQSLFRFPSRSPGTALRRASYACPAARAYRRIARFRLAKGSALISPHPEGVRRMLAGG